MKKLFLTLLLLLFSTSAWAYTFDSEVDPKEFAPPYYIEIETEQVAPTEFVISLKNEAAPKVKNVILLVHYCTKHSFIRAYSYFDKEMKLRNFLYINEHYTEVKLSPKSLKVIIDKLNKLHGFLEL